MFCREEITSTLPVASMRQLLEAGVHFGHQTRRWNPKMRQYIYGARNGIHIIDLQKTVPLFNDAFNFVSAAVSRGESVLFVGTKKQAQEITPDMEKDLRDRGFLGYDTPKGLLGNSPL